MAVNPDLFFLKICINPISDSGCHCVLKIRIAHFQIVRFIGHKSHFHNSYRNGAPVDSSHIVGIWQRKLLDLRDALPENNPIRYVQKIDNVLFSHGGVLDYFAESVVPKSKYHDVEAVVAAINELGPNEMWNDASPIWLRPQHSNMRLYKTKELLQVVGHTPMNMITKEGNLISCDVFSTYQDGKPIGTEEFLLLDTETWECSGVK